MNYKLLSSIFYSDKDNYENCYKARFYSESTYRFDFKIYEYQAFLVINHDILQRIELILELNKKLYRNMELVPNIALNQYARKCIIDEIKITNDIEGVHSTRKEINDILINKENMKQKNRLYGLVKKYEMLLQGNDINLETCSDIKNLYNDLALEDVIADDPNNNPDGEIFRKHSVNVQDDKQRIIHNGVYPETEIINCMESSLKMLNSDNYNFFIKIAIFHYMFGYIHPFYDGNGRMTRFISSYLLSKKLEFLVPIRLSYTIKENIKTYYKIFKETNKKTNKGDLTYFVIRFFDLIIQSIQELSESLDNKSMRLLHYGNIAEKVFNDDNKALEVTFLLIQNTLFGDNGLSVQEINEISEVGLSKIRNVIKLLGEKELLYVQKEGRKNIYDINLDTFSEDNIQI
ncbi:Fic family protein [Clostridioides difficile]|uniref:Fic family protein n=1 Tax=Clostridioides difficile TaxID=1496 RepID=UPI0021D24B7C|nr:Fic family protein [Clostridioides difficile]MCU5873431.1 Fic family protein [Clostridioides difficile]MCU5897199.1 Fic family protein [Clostridioides difficile]